MTPEQAQVLKELVNAKAYPDGRALANWVAEGCNHHYDTQWASTRIQSLIKRGYVERGERGYYRATDAGRAALKPTPAPKGTSDV